VAKDEPKVETSPLELQKQYVQRREAQKKRQQKKE
jgi:hypothetical protein